MQKTECEHLYFTRRKYEECQLDIYEARTGECGMFSSLTWPSVLGTHQKCTNPVQGYHDKAWIGVFL